jgi:VCBS repeat-containing protein
LAIESLEGRTVLASVSGIVFSDLNENGAFEPATGETPISGRTIYVDSDRDGTHDLGTEPSVATDGSGRYVFSDLDGTVRISQVVPIGSRQTAPTGPSNVLAAASGVIKEYSRDGELVQSLIVPDPLNGSGAVHTMGDVAVDRFGRIHVYHGNTDGAYISTYTPWTKIWEHHTRPGFAIAQFSAGRTEMSILDDYLYVGRTRFNIHDWSWIEFSIPPQLTFSGITDVQIGGNGKLYAASGSSAQVALYELDAGFSLIRSIALIDDHQHVGKNAVAVAANGDIFAASEKLYHFDSQGNLLRSVEQNSRYAIDMELSADGDILVGHDFGLVILKKSDFTEVFAPIVSFSTQTYVGFATYQGAGRSPISHKLVLVESETRTGVDFGVFDAGIDSRLAVRDDIYVVPEDGQLILPAPGVLANDTGIGSTPLTVIGVREAEHDGLHGRAPVNADGSIAYHPGFDFYGTDRFVYRLRRGEIESGTATVTVIVTPVNDPPVAGNELYTVMEDGELTVDGQGVLQNDHDLENDPLTARIIDQPQHGTLALDASGSFRYVPDANYQGSDQFTYVANDGTDDSQPATVTLRVLSANDRPVPSNDHYVVAEDGVLTVAAPGVLSNDSDMDGNLLSAFFAGTPAHGQLSLNRDGGFTYRPVANYSGLDQFVYRSVDFFPGVTATVFIEVTPQNDDPGVIIDPMPKVDERSPLILSGTFNDPDAGDSWTATVDFGDGLGEQPLTLGPDKRFAVAHTYEDSGSYVITVRVRDAAGAEGTAQTSVVVASRPVGTTLHAGVLALNGSRQHDNLAVRLSGSRIIVNATYGGTHSNLSFRRAAVQRIVADLGNGDDLLRIESRLRQRLSVDAGAGNDRVYVGGGAAVVVGGEGNDLLYGGRGRDVLIGGEGRDQLWGYGGSDLLISGRTTYDGDTTALNAIMAEWVSSRDYWTRVVNLRNGSGPLLEGLDVRLVAGETVLQDAAADTVMGSGDLDWFFMELGRDVNRERRKGETVN